MPSSEFHILVVGDRMFGAQANKRSTARDMRWTEECSLFSSKPRLMQNIITSERPHLPYIRIRWSFVYSMHVSQAS